MKFGDSLIRIVGPRNNACPNESDVLAYTENTLTTRRRLDIERHMSGCGDCQSLLGFLGRESITHSGVTDQEVSRQTDRILSYIQNDQRNREHFPSKQTAKTGFSFSYPMLAAVGLVVCAIGAGLIFVLTREQPSVVAMASLKQAVKNTRLSEARISGGLDYSRYSGPTRGADGDNDDFYLSRAESKLKDAAAHESNGIANRMMLARVYLARGTRDGASRALELLKQLLNTAGENSELFNDIGVGHVQRSEYAEAIEYFNKALARNPRYSEGLFNLALAEEFDQRTADARRDWQSFIEQSSDEKWKAEASAHLRSLERRR